MNTPDSILISALRILARDVESEDGVANAMLFEAADRFGKLVLEAYNLRAEIERLNVEKHDLLVRSAVQMTWFEFLGRMFQLPKAHEKDEPGFFLLQSKRWVTAEQFEVLKKEVAK